MHIGKGANVQHCQSVWGQISTHIIFERGANIRGEHVLHSFLHINVAKFETNIQLRRNFAIISSLKTPVYNSIKSGPSSYSKLRAFFHIVIEGPFV